MSRDKTYFFKLESIQNSQGNTTYFKIINLNNCSSLLGSGL